MDERWEMVRELVEVQHGAFTTKQAAELTNRILERRRAELMAVPRV